MVIGNGRFPGLRARRTGLSDLLQDPKLIREAEVRNLPGDTLGRYAVRARQIDIIIGDQEPALPLGQDQYGTDYYLSRSGQVGQTVFDREYARFGRCDGMTVVNLKELGNNKDRIKDSSIVREWQTDERGFRIPDVIFGAPPNLGNDSHEVGDAVVSLLTEAADRYGIKPDDMKS